MENDTCERCGGSHSGPRSLCDDCSNWLREKPTLSDEDVVDTVQFGALPINSTDYIVLLMGSVAIPLLLGLSGITILLIDVYSSRSSPTTSTSPMTATLVPFLAVLCSLGAIFYCALWARRNPWLGALTALAVTVVAGIPLAVLAASELPAVQVSYIRAKGLGFSLEEVLTIMVVLQLIGVVMLGIAVRMAAVHRRLIRDARARLQSQISEPQSP